jgi:hypothetical protein
LIFSKPDFLHVRRNKSFIPGVFHYADAARPLLNRIPDFQQATVAVLVPLMIPESQRLNALLRQKFFPRFVALDSLRRTVLRTVQFDGEFRVRAIEIQNVIADRVLAAEFETGETSPAQRPPEFFFFIGLIATKFAGDLFEVHCERMRLAKNKFKPLTLILSPFSGERRKITAASGVFSGARRR